tara:strand:+ start:48405 stop:49895 length:1491 start_codon:yes stop_codon:yes gene_type:complete
MNKVGWATKKSAQILLFIFTLFLFCCSTTKPINVKTLDIHFPDNWVTDIPDSKPYTGKWWEIFKDTTLERIIQNVEAKSPNLKSIIHRQKIALQNARIRGASILPSMVAIGTGNKSKQNLAGFGFADSFLNMGNRTDSSSITAQQKDQVISFDNEIYGINLNFQWEIDVWGRILNGRRAAFKDYESITYELSYVRFSYLVRCAQTYFQSVEVSEQLKLAKESYSSLVEIRDIVKDRYNRGLRSSLDYRLAETSVSTSQLLIENRKNQLMSLKRQLEIMMADYPSGTIVISNGLPENLPMVPDGIPANILNRRPDVRSLLIKVEASDLRVAQAKRNLLPGITLNGSAGTSTNELKEVFNNDNGIWNLGLNITTPIFNGKRLRSAVKLQQAFSEQLKYELVQSLLNSFSEVEQLLILEKSLLIQLKALSNAVKQSGDAYALSKERYDSGVTSLESVLNSQRQYNDIRSQELTIRRLRIENRLSLLLVLGGDVKSYNEK